MLDDTSISGDMDQRSSLSSIKSSPIRIFNDYGSEVSTSSYMDEYDAAEREKAKFLKRKKYHVINVPAAGNRRVKIMAI